LAPWELRVGNLRVYYDVYDSEDDQRVSILAIGKKIRESIRIGGREIRL
jgi:hypothetical protein